MNDLEKLLKGAKTLAFVDIEGTEISHEMIEIGVFRVDLKDDLTIKKIHRPYRNYVKAKHRVGAFVTKLTGITDKLIKEKGVSFRQVQNDLKKYLKKDYSKCLFVTYGAFDKIIMTSSAENNMDASMEEARYFAKKNIDFCQFLSRFIKGEDGNPLSQTNALKVFGRKLEGQAHDACDDARNLISLYDAFTKEKEILKAEYKKVIERANNVPPPIRKVIAELRNGKTVSPEQFDNFVEESLK